MWEALTWATSSGVPWATTCPAAVAALRPHVDHPVGGLDDVQVVFDHQHGVARVGEALQDVEQLLDVGEVQAGGRLVQDVDRAARGALGQVPSPA